MSRPTASWSRLRGSSAAGLSIVVVALGTGCGSDERHAPRGPQFGSLVKGKLGQTCRTALARYGSLQSDLAQVLADPSNSAAAKRLHADAETLKPPLAKLISAADPDQQAALSVFRSELRDVQTALAVGNATTAKGLLNAQSRQLTGLPRLIGALCKA
jgi:hypothetical protein